MKNNQNTFEVDSIELVKSDNNKLDNQLKKGLGRGLSSLLGDSSKAKKILGWEPKVSFSELVSLMVEKDIELAKQERVLVDNNLLEPTWENAIF